MKELPDSVIEEMGERLKQLTVATLTERRNAQVLVHFAPSDVPIEHLAELQDMLSGFLKSEDIMEFHHYSVEGFDCDTIARLNAEATQYGCTWGDIIRQALQTHFNLLDQLSAVRGNHA